jgi:hypothetical protein
MSRTTEIIKFLQNYNAWRRGDETLEMPHPAEIGMNIQDAVVILREHDELKQRAEQAKADLDQVACARTDGILRESDLQCRLNMERARLKKIETALKDAISTYFGDDKLVTAERIEAWQAALKEDAK